MRAAVVISAVLLVISFVGSAVASCGRAWVGSSARAMPASGRAQGLSLGFDGSIRHVNGVRVAVPPNPGATFAADPSGRWTMYWAPGGRLFVRGPNAEVTLATRVELVPAWRPDGAAIAFAQDEPDGIRLEVADKAVGFRARPLQALVCSTGRLVWSPDGSLIAAIAPSDGKACAGGESLVVVDAKSGAVLSHAAVPPQAFLAGWSADGRYVAASPLAIAGQGLTLLPRSPSADARHLLADCTFVSWAPRASELAASCGATLARAKLTLVDATTARRAPSTASTLGLPAAGSVWSADGSRFAALTQRGFVLARADGTTKLIPISACTGATLAGFTKNGRVLVRAYNKTVGN